MHISDKGIHFIIKEEGLRLKAYRCQAGVWTIGVGHTAGVKQGDTITQERAYELLKRDLKGFEDVLNENIQAQLKQHEFDSLMSFIFNVGAGAFKKSTLLKKLNNKEDITEEFKKWKYGGGRVLPVLIARRKRELILFKEGKYE